MMAKLPTAADLIPETPALDGSNDLSMWLKLTK
jgi:hypothetical protein